MNVVDLRERILEYVKIADENHLKQMDDLINENRSDSEISDEHKQILDERLEQHKANPKSGRSWGEIKSELSSKYGV